MFTIKYIYPHGQEMIAGPFDRVHSEYQDEKGNSYDHEAAAKMDPRERPPMFRVVYAYNGHSVNHGNESVLGSPTLTMGPNLPDNTETRPSRQARVYVMNDSGATVASYEL